MAEISVSYVIFIENGTIKSRNGSTGVIDFQGTDASTVINQTIDALSLTGGKIVMKKGNYTITSPILLKSNIWLAGEGRNATILQAGNNLDSLIKGYSGTAVQLFVKISNLTIDGRKDTYLVDTGITFDVRRGILENLEMKNLSGTAIRVKGYTTDDKALENFLKKILIFECSKGIVIGDYASDFVVSDIAIRHADIGIEVRTTGVGTIFFDYIHIYYSNVGFWIKSKWHLIYNSFLDNLSREGVILDASEEFLYRITINNCLLWNCGKSADNTYDAIRLKSYPIGEGHEVAKVIVSNCHIWSDAPNRMRYGISEELDNRGGDNAFINNIISGFATKAIKRVIPASGRVPAIIHPNVGYVTENSGTATITGDGVTTEFTVDVTHGLVSDKASVKVSCKKDHTYKAYLVDTDADGTYETIRIVITFTTAPAGGETVEIYWSAEVV